MHRHKSPTALTTTAKVMGALSLVVLFVTTAGGVADAATAAPITDYASYPAAIPADCPPGSPAVKTLSFANGRGGTAADLRELDVRRGDTVTMSWTAFAAGCLNQDGSPAIEVGLAGYDQGGAVFDASVDQKLLAGWQACGANAGACTMTNGRYQLQVTLPSTGACQMQLDSFIGLPLAVVGPSGSFYSSALRGGEGGNRLISAVNFGPQTCEEPTTTTSQSVVPTSTSAPASTTTAPATTTTTPTTTAASSPAQITSPTTGAVVQAQVVTLPATGQNSLATIKLAGWLGLAGSVILLAAATLRRRPYLFG